MKTLNNFIQEKLSISKYKKQSSVSKKEQDDTTVTIEPWAEFIHINTEKGYIEYLKSSDLNPDIVKNNGGYGQTTQTEEGILICIV